MTPSEVAREWLNSKDNLASAKLYGPAHPLVIGIAKLITQAISEERERICRVVHEEFYHEIPEQQLLDAIRKL